MQGARHGLKEGEREKEKGREGEKERERLRTDVVMGLKYRSLPLHKNVWRL